MFFFFIIYIFYIEILFFFIFYLFYIYFLIIFLFILIKKKVLNLFFFLKKKGMKFNFMCNKTLWLCSSCSLPILICDVYSYFGFCVLFYNSRFYVKYEFP